MRAWYLGKVTDPRAPNKLAELDLESLKGRVYIERLWYWMFCLIIIIQQLIKLKTLVRPWSRVFQIWCRQVWFKSLSLTEGLFWIGYSENAFHRKWTWKSPELDKSYEKLKEERGYSYQDVVTISRKLTADYDNVILKFFREHIHNDSEIRFVHNL